MGWRGRRGQISQDLTTAPSKQCGSSQRIPCGGDTIKKELSSSSENSGRNREGVGLLQSSWERGWWAGTRWSRWRWS